MENQVADPPHPSGQPDAARPRESSNLAEWLTEGRGLLEDIRTSLDTRYASESEEEEPTAPSWRGIGIALGAFVPTFLLIFLGLPYLLAPASAPSAPPAEIRPMAADTRLGSPSPPSMDRLAASLSELLDTGALSATWANGASARASSPARVEATPVKSVAAGTVAWTRAAAFADQRAADRLADTMRHQGYRVEIRREESAALPWVVWTRTVPVSSRVSN